MKKTEIYCVDCGLPCLGDLCKNRQQEVHYCDECEIEIATLELDGSEYCVSCAKQHLLDIFNDLSVKNQATAVDLEIHDITTEWGKE